METLAITSEETVRALRDATYARPTARPGCAREHDATWDLIDPAGYSVREIEPGHWHVVAGGNLVGWYCTGRGRDHGCLSWSDVVTRFEVGRDASPPVR